MNHNVKILPISLLIPTMNRPETLMHTLQCYFRQPCIPGQIVVVDQSQSLDVRKEIQDLLRPYEQMVQVDYIWQKLPSLTKARNQAMQKAVYEIVVCSDDDVEVYPKTLENVYTIFQQERIAMIAGLDDCMKPSSCGLSYLMGTRSYWKRKIGHVTASVLGRYPSLINGRVETQWAMGYFFAIRKSCALRWGLKWDEKLLSYAYAEDLDYSYGYYLRAKKEKRLCILDDSVRVKHLTSTEYRIPATKSTRMYVLHRAYIAHKYRMGIVSILAMKWCNAWIYAIRCLRTEAPEDMWQAQRILRKEKKKVLDGNFEGLY